MTKVDKITNNKTDNVQNVGGNSIDLHYFDKEKLSLTSLWILARFEKCENEVENSLQKLEIASVIDTLYRFLWDELAAWYLEFLKTDNSDLEFGKVIFEKYIIILSPFAPFVSQFLWENFFGKNDLIANLNLENVENTENLVNLTNLEMPNNSQFNSKLQSSQNNSQPNLQLNSESNLFLPKIALPKIKNEDWNKIEEFEKIIVFVTKIRSLRGLFGIDFGTPITILTDSSLLLQFAGFTKHLAKVEIANTNLDSKLDNLFEIKIGQKTPIIAKIDLISYIKDPQKQLTKAQKELESLTKQIENLEKQLQNPEFAKRADAEIIKQKQCDLQNRKIDLNFQTQKIDFLKPLLN